MTDNIYITVFRLIVPITIISLFFACENEITPKLNNDLIFNFANEIKIPSYSYQSESGLINVLGDAGYAAGVIDTLTSAPELHWDSIQTTRIVAAIFSEPIQISGGIIVNTSDIVWIWHSGLESGRNGKVEFLEGRSINNSNIMNLTAPMPLIGNSIYYWGVWGWDASGVKILYSSRPICFYIK